jgi:hypothetical protein
MKKLILACLVVLAFGIFGSGAFADEYDQALKTAKKENKPVVLYFFNTACYYCTLMDKNTLADAEIAAMLKKDFVFLRIDSEKSRHLAKLYSIKGTPTSWFLDSSGKRVFEAPGYIQKPLFKKVLEYIKGKHYNDIDLQEYLKKTPGKN